MSSFLIIQTAFIGDVVLATAVAEKLHEQYPNAGIDILVRKGNESLLTDHPFLRKVWVWDKTNRKIYNLLQLAKNIRRQRYDQVINLHRFASSGILTALSGAKQTRGFDKNPLSSIFSRKFPHIISKAGDPDPVHETQRNQSLIADLTDAQPALPRLYPSKHQFDAVAGYKSSPYYCIAPASVWFTKQFPAEKWTELIQLLPPDSPIYILGGKGDKALAAELRAMNPGRQLSDLTGQFSFLESAALMRDAVMNYVNDSGPLHFCSAVNAPVTAVFLSTVPEFGFGPLSTQSRVVELKGLYCKPCGLHGYKTCPEGHFRCALEIKAEELL